MVEETEVPRRGVPCSGTHRENKAQLGYEREDESESAEQGFRVEGTAWAKAHGLEMVWWFGYDCSTGQRNRCRDHRGQITDVLS